MELRPGYKQTEVGVIPVDWDAIPLSRTARRITRGASPRPIDSPVWFDNASSIGWVRISDVTRSHRYLEETTQRLSEAGVHSSRFVGSGSLIMSICATVGRPIETRIDSCIHDGFVVFDQPKIDQSFLYHLLVDLEPTWSRRGQTGSQMNLNTGLIDGRLVAVPRDECEQRAIADTLSDVDALLGGLGRLIAKKHDLKQAAMQRLLTGKVRLPGFSGAWENRRVAEMGDVLAGKALDVNGPGVLRPYLRTKNVLDGRIDLEDVLQMPMTDSEFTRFCIEPGDVLLNEGQSLELVGRCSIYSGELGSPCAMQNQLLRFRAHAGTCPQFSAHVFRHCQRTGIFAALATQTTSVAHLGSSRLTNLRLLWPSASLEQTAIADVLTDMDAEIAALERRRDKTRALKRAIMQELLTGRTRLVTPQAAHA